MEVPDIASANSGISGRPLLDKLQAIKHSGALLSCQAYCVQTCFGSPSCLSAIYNILHYVNKLFLVKGDCWHSATAIIAVYLSLNEVSYAAMNMLFRYT